MPLTTQVCGERKPNKSQTLFGITSDYFTAFQEAVYQSILNKFVEYGTAIARKGHIS